MRIIETKAYKFDELSPEAQEKAIEKLWDCNVEFGDWWNYTYEDAENVGLKITDFDLDYHTIHGEFTDSADYTASKIMENHGMTCETYLTARGYIQERDQFLKTAERDEYGELATYKLEHELEDIEKDFLSSLLEDYRMMLNKEYDYLTGREAIIETIQENEWEFTENGKKI